MSNDSHTYAQDAHYPGPSCLNTVELGADEGRGTRGTDTLQARVIVWRAGTLSLCIESGAFTAQVAVNEQQLSELASVIERACIRAAAVRMERCAEKAANQRACDENAG